MSYRYARFSTQAAEQEDLEASIQNGPIIHRHAFRDTVWITESFTVNDAVMRALLCRALNKYQDFDPELENWTFRAPYSPIVHRWSQLNDLCETSVGLEERTATSSLMDFLRPILAPSIEALSKTKETGKVLFDDVWQIYPPGEVAMTAFYGIEAAARVVRYEKKRNRQGLPSWEVELEYIDWNGDHCGFATTTVNIGFFSGYKFVTSLAAYPLSFCSDEEQIKERLTSRGRQFESLRGYHFRSCVGTKILLETPQREERPVKGRVIVDSFAYFSSNNIVKPALRSLKDDEDQRSRDRSEAQPVLGGTPLSYRPQRHVAARRQQRQNSPVDASPAPAKALPQYPGQPMSAWPMVEAASGLQGAALGGDATTPGEKLPATENRDGAFMTAITSKDKHSRKEDLEPMSDYQCLLATTWLRGLDLKTKDWALFNISDLSEIVWNDDAFDRLVLPGNEKDLAWQFVENKRLASNDFDDFIADKGRGIIVLMFGPPGVGKTYTAEAVSERARVPLFAISAASLGTASLERALELCRLWEAMLLLDEADIFLAARTDHDIARNELVAVFLTKLEYYQGVCFLTTNRIKSLDHAFQSRIDLFLPYANLTPEARRQVWENFIERAGRGKFEVSERGLEELSKIQLNGREIKNLIKSAHLLSLKDGEVISLTRLQTLAENRDRALRALSY
ncbi:hypothetical protein N0V82_003774 [Gnomoniopsis sp. IMI 355080]|nr:hypothetical protein N0V82_003774 [Gnomoniopsis sp. IMI 355080]